MNNKLISIYLTSFTFKLQVGLIAIKNHANYFGYFGSQPQCRQKLIGRK